MRIPGFEYEFDDELSFKNFTNLTHVDGKIDFNGKAIYESHFTQERLDVEVFPSDVKDLILVNCHLDNVIIPAGVTVINTNGVEPKRYVAQNDGNDWIVDELDRPVKPIDFKIFEKRGLPIPRPEDIPAEKTIEVVDLRQEAEIKKMEIEAEALSEAIIN